jgi:uncharacterized protein YqjF (DUF2071 family)
MRQTWADLLFAHWPVDSAALAPHVPGGIEIDRFEGRAWLTIAPFDLQGLRLRLMPPLPGASTFPELNVRTYVRMADRPGIFFFSLDAGSLLAVTAARTLLNLPYRHARMRIERASDGEVHYDSERREPPSATFAGRYRPLGPPFEAAPGSLDEWLAERYCLYTRILGGWWRLEIDHAPWPLQRAEAELEINTMAAPLGIELGLPALLHFAKRQDTVAWLPCPAGEAVAAAARSPRRRSSRAAANRPR